MTMSHPEAVINIISSTGRIIRTLGKMISSISSISNFELKIPLRSTLPFFHSGTIKQEPVEPWG